MRKIFASLLFIICVAGASAVTADYGGLKKRADRFFDNSEWASASAYYTFMLEQHPEVADTYGRAIVSCMMGGDTIRPNELLKSAMAHKVPLDSVLSDVRLYAFAKDSASLYPRFLLSAAHNEPWLRRAVDAMLLKYYQSRNDGPMIVRYSRVMLAGLPADARFLSSLAHGYMLTGEYAQAVDTWERILKADPDNYDTLLQIGAYYMADGKKTEARPYYERAYALRPTPFVARLLSEAHNAPAQ